METHLLGEMPARLSVLILTVPISWQACVSIRRKNCLDRWRSDQITGMEQALDTAPKQVKRSAVVVDDDQVIVMLLDHLLSRRGFDVHKAMDGRQAVNFLESLPEPPA